MLGTTAIIGPGGLIPQRYTQNPAAPGPAPVIQRPALPDGSYYECEEKFQPLVDSVLASLNAEFQVRPGHTHVFRMILQLNLEVARLTDWADQEDKKTNPNTTNSSKWRDSARSAMKSLADLYKSLGLVGKDANTQTPQQYIDELRERVKQFAEEHALERAYACQRCGTIHMVYALMHIDVKPDWPKLRAELMKRGVRPQAIDEVITGMGTIADDPRAGIPMLGKLVHTPYTHPFLNHPTFPIWSPVIRRYIEEGKLTIEEGAEILQISPAGMDQMLQEWRKAEGLQAIEGVDVEAAGSVFLEGTAGEETKVP